MRDPLIPVDGLTGQPLPEPVEVDRGPDMPLPDLCAHTSSMLDRDRRRVCADCGEPRP